MGNFLSCPTSVAPLDICLYPTQLYSAFSLFCIGLILYKYQKQISKKPGRLLSTYLISIALERFIVDFWRDDRVMKHPQDLVSFDQKIAIAVIAAALILFLYTHYKKVLSHEY